MLHFRDLLLNQIKSNQMYLIQTTKIHKINNNKGNNSYNDYNKIAKEKD